jgi:hypothetical protein
MLGAESSAGLERSLQATVRGATSSAIVETSEAGARP